MLSYVCHLKAYFENCAVHTIFHPQHAALYAICAKKQKLLPCWIMPHLQAGK